MNSGGRLQPRFAPRNPRRQKTDKRDAEHILVCWWRIVSPPSGSRRQRTNNCGNCCCIAVAWSGCARGDEPVGWDGQERRAIVPGGWSVKRRKAIEALPLPAVWRAAQGPAGSAGPAEERIAPLDKSGQPGCGQQRGACLLMTHPGVGSGGLTGLCV